MNSPHTVGPWRWVFNRKHKRMTLVGGKPTFDLTIMDFDRWGMNGAVATMRDTAHDGFNIMHRVCDRPDWVAPLPGREHHADWCSGVTHPDLLLIAAAPCLLAAMPTINHPAGALVKVVAHYADGTTQTIDGEVITGAVNKATGGAT